MQGRHVLHLAILPIDHELERTLRNLKQACGQQAKSKPKLVDEIVKPRVPMQDKFQPKNIEFPSCIALQPNVEGNMHLSLQMLSMVPHFSGKAEEDPHLHLIDFFNLAEHRVFKALLPNKSG
ncbi:hypothetical protein TB1_030627 [Malus domestica]